MTGLGGGMNPKEEGFLLFGSIERRAHGNCVKRHLFIIRVYSKCLAGPVFRIQWLRNESESEGKKANGMKW